MAGEAQSFLRMKLTLPRSEKIKKEIKKVKGLKFIVLLFTGILISSSVKTVANYLNVQENGFTTLVTHTRAKGMGGAFVAIADDYGACYFNPAGLLQIKHKEIGAMYTDLYGMSLLTHSILSYVEPDSGMGAGGISWSHLSANLEPEKWDFDLFYYSYGQFFSPSEFTSKNVFSSWGINLKYLREIIEEEEAKGYGLDLTFLIRGKKISWGGNFQNIFSQVDWTTGKKESLPLNLKLGMAYTFSPCLILALDFDLSRNNIPEEIHLGGEWWIGNNVALRLGGRKIFQESSKIIFSGGMGFYFPTKVEIEGVKAIKLDYAFSYDESLANTQQFSLSFIL